MSAIPKPVEVYAESTPNPAALKFVTNRMLLAEGQVEYHSVRDATSCPLAIQLFAFSGVRSVFITGNFITIHKDHESDWYELMPVFREFIKSYLASGDKVFTANPSEKPSVTEEPVVVSGETETQIIRLLDEYVRPAVEQDGGNISFVSYENGVVKVRLQGSCHGCPSSMLTLKSGIENLLKKMLPEVKEVVAE